MNRRPTSRLAPVLLALLLLSGLPLRPSAGVPCRQCFPVEDLPPQLRARYEDLLLKALDGEALYTFVGNLKPMSSGFFSASLPAENPPPAILTELEETRRILAAWSCGNEYYAGLHHFAKVYEGKRYLDGMIISRRLLDQMISRRRFFAGFGITPGADPAEVVSAVEYSPAAERLRHYGYLFGYPDHAVDFFVAAARSQELDGQFVKREFLRLPTFRAADERSPFVYAVPVGHVENDADRQIRREAESILTLYKAWRGKYVGPGRPGVVKMMRDWFRDGGGQCSPLNAPGRTP